VGTINHDLAVVRHVLILASRLWRDETDRPWLPVAPLIQMERDLHRRPPYPLSAGRELNHRHADFQSFLWGSRGL
jgi:hypothetical protein